MSTVARVVSATCDELIGFICDVQYTLHCGMFSLRRPKLNVDTQPIKRLKMHVHINQIWRVFQHYRAYMQYIMDIFIYDT